ncbi:hypothetical protein HDU91_002261 [Kappamyces sp. JEL0680]|nr:hypothetical protein HDU91_002261 [Kappamyces sp. JEL0680]
MLLLTGPEFPSINWTKDDDPSKSRYAIQDQVVYLAVPADGTLAKNHKQATATSVWDCSLILGKYLESIQSQVAGCTVLELGAGCGLCGLVSAYLKADRVYLTDVAFALASLQNSVELNGLETVCSVREVDWLCPGAGLEPGGVDIILLADVVWVLDLIAPLVETIDFYAGPATRIYLAHQSRSSLADELLWKCLRERRFVVAAIDHVHPVYHKSAVSLYSISKCHQE